MEVPITIWENGDTTIVAVLVDGSFLIDGGNDTVVLTRAEMAELFEALNDYYDKER